MNPRIRSTLYLLPLFLAWLPGITWEKTIEGRRAALRSFFLFLLFIVLTLIVYLVYSILDTFLPGSTAGRLFAYYGQSFVSFLYVAVSFLVPGLEYFGSYEIAFIFPDKWLWGISGFTTDNTPTELKAPEPNAESGNPG